MSWEFSMTHRSVRDRASQHPTVHSQTQLRRFVHFGFEKMQINVYTDFQTVSLLCFVALMCACVCVYSHARARIHKHACTRARAHTHTHTHLSTEIIYRKGTNAQLILMVIKHKSHSLL